MSTQMLTMSQVADRLKLSLSATKRLVYDREIPSVTIGRARRVREVDLDAFIADRLAASDGGTS